jgi:hypothetical protein
LKSALETIGFRTGIETIPHWKSGKEQKIRTGKGTGGLLYYFGPLSKRQINFSLQLDIQVNFFYNQAMKHL